MFEEELNRLNLVVFTTKDVCRITGKPLNYCKIFLSRLVKKRKILRIEKGKYCTKKAGLLTIASNLVFPCYVSFLSALEFHKLTTQIPFEVQVVCLKQKKSILFENNCITFTKFKKNRFFGFKKINQAFIAEPEKAVIDGLYLPEKMPVSEANYAIMQNEMNTGKLIEYADKFESAVVKKRLGYLLEQANINAEKLCKGLTKKYDFLNPLLQKKGEKNKKWKLIINEVLE